MVIKYVFRALLFIGITSEIVIFISVNIFSVSVGQWLWNGKKLDRGRLR